MPLIDDAARIVASDLPRREMLRRLARLMTGTFLVGLSVPRLRAQFCEPACSPPTVCCGESCCSAVCCDSVCCGVGQSCCNGACTDTTSDPNNCGTCGNVCDTSCSGGVCVVNPCAGVVCPAGSVCQGGDCVFLSVPTDAHQVIDPSNLNVGDSTITLTNTGARNGFDPAGGICANVYTFDPSEEMISCCSCYVSPDGLKALSIRQDLLSNTLTPSRPDSVVVKLVASAPLANSTCNPASPNGTNLAPGMLAWGTKLHQNTATGKFDMTEIASAKTVISPTELQKLTTYCAFIQANGSGFGICKSCRLGGLGGAQQ